MSNFWKNLFYTDKQGVKKYIPRPVFWLYHVIVDRFDSRIVLHQLKWINVVAVYLQNRVLKKRLCIGWLLCGNRDTPSSRIQGVNIHKYLLRQGASSVICYGTNSYSEELHINSLARWLLLNSGFNVLVFQKVYRGMSGELLKECRRKGIKTVLIISDYPLDYDISLLNAYDKVVAVSSYFKQMLCSGGLEEGRVSVIGDAIETPASLCKDYDRVRNGAPIKVVWVGYELTPAQHKALEIVRDALRHSSLSDYKLVLICKGSGADIVWRLRTVWREILKCDIAVIPSDVSEKNYKVKSNNRLTLFKALGLPVICSPLPAYREIVREGESGFFAETVDDWARCLAILKDAHTRQRVGLAGREELFLSYGIEAIGGVYLELFRTVCDKRWNT